MYLTRHLTREEFAGPAMGSGCQPASVSAGFWNFRLPRHEAY